MAKFISGIIAQQERESDHGEQVQDGLGQLQLDEQASAMSESLNAGLEDEEEDGYEPSVFESLEGPGIEPYADQVHAMESLVQDLEYLANDVEKAGGMSQTFALEAQKLLPGFGDSAPIGYYTAKPTATRYVVAMEELSKGVWAAIIAAAGAIIAAVVAFFRWMAGEKKPEGGDAAHAKGEAKDVPAAQSKAEKAIDQLTETAEKIPQALVKANSALHNGQGLLANANVTLTNEKGVEKHCKSFQEVIDHVFDDEERYGRAKKFLAEPDPVLYDIVTHGPYSKAVSGVAHNVRLINQAIHIKLNNLDQIVRRDLNSFTKEDQLINTHELKELNQPLEVPLDGKSQTLNQIAQALYNERQEVISHAAVKPLLFDELFESLTKAYLDSRIQMGLKDLKSSMKMLGDLEKRVEKLQDIARDLNSDGVPGALSQDVGSFVRKTLITTMADLQGFAMLCHQLRNYMSQMEYAARETIAFGREIVRKVVAQLRKEGRDVPEAWNQVLEDMNRQLAAITKAYYSFK